MPRFLLVASMLCATPVIAAPPDSTSQVAVLATEAKAVGPLFRSKLVAGFLAGVKNLPRVEPRTILCDSARTRCWTEGESTALPDTQRARLVRRTLDETFYYTTRYGSPLAYARPLEILADAGLRDVRGKKIADFGYGTIGHLRLLAGQGAEVHGIEVDPMLRTLYAPDVGAVGGGRLVLHHGQWPAEAALVGEVGSGYDLFISKNTLKRGYIHPAEPVNPRMMVHLGVDDSIYVATLAKAVKPGGLVMIYNLCPAPAPPGKPYIPWADGRCPFDRGLLERTGFQVVAFDKDDSPAARRMAHALGWDAGERPMDLEKDLFATYTILKRR
ncbi:MAG TPA: hypothetical protein VFQ05_08615 [Candidatus Eisenbacteria bacterium]|nr:hypothetical protein [Candidatus Eisenbacteria bacterium]